MSEKILSKTKMIKKLNHIRSKTKMEALKNLKRLRLATNPSSEVSTVARLKRLQK